MTERDVLEFCMANEENYKKVQYVLNSKCEAEGDEYNIIDYRGVCCSIRASSAKNALNKYRRLLTSTGVYSIRKDKERGEWHLISSYGGDWIARLVMPK